MTSAALLPECVIPGCPNPVGAVGEPCAACQTAFGTMLRHNHGGRPMTADEIGERDRAVRAAYAVQREAVR